MSERRRGTAGGVLAGLAVLCVLIVPGANAGSDPYAHGGTRWLAASALWIECRGCDEARAEAAARELPAPVTVIYFDPLQSVSHAFELSVDETVSGHRGKQEGVASPVVSPPGFTRCADGCRVRPAAMSPEQLRFRAALSDWYTTEPVGWNKSFEVRAEAIDAHEWPGSLRHLGKLSAAGVAGNQSAQGMVRQKAGQYLRQLGPLGRFESLSKGTLGTPSGWKMDLVVRFGDGSDITLEYSSSSPDGHVAQPRS